ncbi:MAG: DUF262 domain-containing HNH endonuclease family protein [Hyphomonadaceae bacterium]
MDQGGFTSLGAQILSVAESFTLGRFAPASVQRDYQWEERQCQELFCDLERVFASNEQARVEEVEPEADSADGGEPDVGLSQEASASGAQRDYVLGALVLRPGGIGYYEVFDGLQRLTSLTILLCVLRDLSGDAGGALERLVLAPDGAFRVTLPGKDATLRDEVQRRGEAGKARRAPTSDMGARVRAACTYFRRELSRWTGERRAAFTDFLLHRVQLVSILVSDPLLARQIFVTTNARGLPLDKVELFKGQLIDIAQDEATADHIARTWTDVQTLVGDDLEELLAALDFVERREPQGAERLTLLAEHLLRRYSGEGIHAWMDRLALFAAAWRDLHQRLGNPADPDAGAAIWTLRLFKWREWKPLALIWMAQFLQQRGQGGDRARQTFARRFDQLHRRCMAITLAGNSDVDRHKIFGRAIGQVARKRDPLDRQGALGFDAHTHARIQETLRMPLVHDETRLTLLRWLEAAQWETNPPRGITRASAEHVLPLRPRPDSHWLQDFPAEEARFNVSHALGNLALIDYKANEDMGNADFAGKLPVLRAQASKYRLVADIAGERVWSTTVIAARTKRLSDLAWAALQLPPPRTPARR